MLPREASAAAAGERRKGSADEGQALIFYPPLARLASVLPREATPYLAALTQAAQAEKWPVELLAAICWRESWFGLFLMPQNPGGVGDDGHGRGLMQIDDRSHRDWVSLKNAVGEPLWTNPQANIAKGASILTDCRRYLPHAPLAAHVAAYNAGPAKVGAAISLGRPADSVTTNRNYSAYVIGKASISHDLARNGDPCDCVLCGQKIS